MHKRLAAIAVAVSVGAMSAPVLSQQGETEPLRVASWNIAHLASEAGQGCVPRTETDYRLVAETIDQVDADIWLLQEIENEEALSRVFDARNWTFHIENRPDTGQGPICRGRDDGLRLRMQRTAIVVRSDIEHTRGDDLVALDVDGRGFLRHGVTITMDMDGVPVDLLSVHLKSGCFFGDTRDACETLFRQIPVLESWIDDRSEAGRAVLVGGDFNRRLEGDRDIVWADLNDADPVALSLAGEGVGPQCDPRYRQFIDFLLVNEIGSSITDLASFNETTFREGARPSDHCPITVDLR